PVCDDGGRHRPAVRRGSGPSHRAGPQPGECGVSPLDWSWVALSAALLVVGGVILGIRIGVALERRRAQQRRRPLRDVAPTLVMPAIPPAPTAQEMRAYIGPTCRADRSQP